MRQKIVFSRGFWWFHDPSRRLEIKLDPLFEECGWRIDALIGILAIGKRSFARVMMESLGIRGKLWMRRTRIVIAGHLLREGTEIKVVALQMSFKDQANFTREFKILYGVSPSDFKKSEASRSGPRDFAD